MSHMSQVQNPNGSARFLLSHISSQVVTHLPAGPGGSTPRERKSQRLHTDLSSLAAAAGSNAYTTWMDEFAHALADSSPTSSDGGTNPGVSEASHSRSADEPDRMSIGGLIRSYS